MPKAREVVLTPEQERELIWTRDHHQKAYVRTKAAAILKVAAGQAMRQVAVHGLLKPVKEEGVWQVLERFDLVYKRGRRYVHSPDPDYPVKAARLRSVWQQVQAARKRLVLLYEDELTYYRCPTGGCDYATAGSDASRAAQGSGYNTSRRIASCLDACTGRLICWQRSTFDHQTFLRYLQAVEACYPDAEHIYIALDNWPVHFQPDVLAGLHNSKHTPGRLPTHPPLPHS